MLNPFRFDQLMSSKVDFALVLVKFRVNLTGYALF